MVHILCCKPVHKVFLVKSSYFYENQISSYIVFLYISFQRLKTLLLRECNWLSAGAMESLITHLDNLEVVDMSSCPTISNQQLLPFLQKFHKLVVLAGQAVQQTFLQCRFYVGGNFYFMDFSFLVKFAFRLKEVRVANLQAVNDTTVLVIGRSCGRSLQVLDIRGCGNVTDRGVR